MIDGDQNSDSRQIAKNGASGGDAGAITTTAGSVTKTLISKRGPVSSGDYHSALQVERAEHGSEEISLYVHLPFCPSRCLTCDHHSSVTHDGREIDRYIDGLEREIQILSAEMGGRRTLQQLHLGGGTPNYLSETQLVRLVGIIEQNFTLTDRTDTSLDANAHRASYTQLGLLHGLGFRSINLEIRDLDPQVQEAVGRSQSLEVIRDVVDSARELGFERISTDLVYGLPRQSAGSIQRTLEQLLALNPDRISCFAHSRRQNTFEHQRAVDASLIPSLADKVAMFSRIVDTLSDQNYQWIGLDCFSRQDDPIALAQREGVLHRNWIGYTAHSGRSVVGVGNGAVSDLSSITIRNHPAIDRWRDALQLGELPVAEGELLSQRDREHRHALSDLMCNLQSNNLHPLLGEKPSPAVQSMLDEGLLELDEGLMTVTQHGRFMLHRLWGDSSPAYRWDLLS